MPVFKDLFSEWEKIKRKHPKARNENCSKIEKMETVKVLSTKRFFIRISEIFINKKKNEMSISLADKRNCLFDKKNMNKVLDTSIIEMM